MDHFETPLRRDTVDVSEWFPKKRPPDADKNWEPEPTFWHIVETTAEKVIEVKDSGAQGIAAILEFCQVGLCNEDGELICKNEDDKTRLAKLSLKLLSRIADAVMVLNGLKQASDDDEPEDDEDEAVDPS